MIEPALAHFLLTRFLLELKEELKANSRRFDKRLNILRFNHTDDTVLIFLSRECRL